MNADTPETPQPERFRLFAEIRLILRHGAQVFGLLRPRHRLYLFGAAGLMTAVAACNTALPLLIGDLVDGVSKQTPESKGAFPPAAITFLTLIALMYVIRELLQVWRRALVENTCTRIEKAMTTRAIAQVTRMDLGALTAEKVGALQGRIGRSVTGLVRFVRLGFLDFFPPMLTGAFALTAAVTRQPLLGVVMACVAPFSLYLTVRQLMSQKGVRLQLMRKREEMDGAVVELLGGLDYVRAANTQDQEIARVRKAAESRRELERDHHWTMSLFGCAKALNEGFFHVVVLTLAIYLAMNGSISLGDILTFSMLFLNVMAPLNEIHRGLDEGHECSLLVADLHDLMNKPACRSFETKESRRPAIAPGEVIIKSDDVRVEYDTPAGPRRGLDGVSLEIRHGETIGLAGPSGCGKSTWLRVLLRLTHPTTGGIAVGGVPLECLGRSEIGALFGYVGQNPFVFSGTVAENIAYGCDGATREQIEEAAKKANLHDEITWMPQGYETPIRERGSNLSGGQRQRIALARVFLKDPPVLILDESTSALDTISERHIQRAIDAVRRDRTVIVVAHRLSTLLDADRIYVFQWGRVWEEGTYQELYDRGGFFAELVNSAEHAVNGRAKPVTAAG